MRLSAPFPAAAPLGAVLAGETTNLDDPERQLAADVALVAKGDALLARVAFAVGGKVDREFLEILRLRGASLGKQSPGVGRAPLQAVQLGKLDGGTDHLQMLGPERLLASVQGPLQQRRRLVDAAF